LIFSTRSSIFCVSRRAYSILRRTSASNSYSSPISRVRFSSDFFYRYLSTLVFSSRML
jgi:hypothetical protein